jgi:hypothetical protein
LACFIYYRIWSPADKLPQKEASLSRRSRHFRIAAGRVSRPVFRNINMFFYQISGISPARSCGKEWQNALKIGARSFNMKRFWDPSAVRPKIASRREQK